MTFTSKRQLREDLASAQRDGQRLLEERNSARTALTDVLEATELSAAISERAPSVLWWQTLDGEPVPTVTAIDLDKLKSIVAQRSQQHANEVEGFDRELQRLDSRLIELSRDAAEKASAATRTTVTESILTLVLDALQIRGYRATADTDLFAGILSDVNARNGHTPALKYDTARFEADLRTTLEVRAQAAKIASDDATVAKVAALTTPSSRAAGGFTGRTSDSLSFFSEGAVTDPIAPRVSDLEQAIREGRVFHTSMPKNPKVGDEVTIRRVKVGPVSPATAFAGTEVQVVYNEADALSHINTDAKPTKKKKVDTRRGSK